MSLHLGGLFSQRSAAWTAASIRLILCAVGIVVEPAAADVNVKSCAPEPAVTDIAYGDLVNCEITPIGDSDVFRFGGQTGDVLDIHLLRLSGGANHCYRVVDPDGVIGGLVCAGFRLPGGIGTDVTLTKSGNHSIQVLAAGGNEAFPYSLVLLRALPFPNAARPAGFGEVLDGEIAPAGDVDFFTFNGASGDTVTVNVTRLATGENHCFQVIEPDGAFRGIVCSGFRLPAGISANWRLTKSGTYAIRVVGAGFLGVFPYRLEVQCFGACPAAPGPPVANCEYFLSPSAQVFPSAAVGGTIGVITSPGCSWTASGSAAFLTISSGSAGSGPGTVQYSVAANTSAASRAGTLTVARQMFTVTQSGTAPLLLASPSPLAFGFREGGSPPADQVLSAFTNAASLSFTASATTAAGGAWLSVTPASGSAPSSLIVSVNPARLAPATYNGAVTVTAPGANPAAVSIPVRLAVEAAGRPRLGVDSGALIFSFAQGAAARTERRTVGNEGGGTLAFQVTTATSSGGPWLRASADRGEASLASPASVAITADPGGLGPGTYAGRISISSPSSNESRELPVTMTISAVRQTILLSQTGLTFTAVSGGGVAPPQSFGILNIGQGIMDWSVSTSTLSGGSNWLSVSPARGTTDAATLNVPLVNVAVNAAGLAPGEYYGQVRVEARAADNTPQFISVVLSVLPPGSDPGPVVLPTGLIFTAVGGGSAPAAHTVQIGNLTSGPRTFTSGRLTTDGANWFTAQPAGATVTPGQPVSIQVQASSSGLGPGIRRGVLTLLFADGAVRTVNLLFVLAGSGSPAGSLSRQPAVAQSGCAPTRLLPLFTSLRSDFTAPAGWPNLVEARVVDDCGSLILDGSVIAAFSNGDPSLSLVSLRDGRWSATWQPRNAAAPQVTISITAEVSEQRIRGSAQVSGSLRANLSPPVVGPAAVVSAASFSREAPLAPGSLVSVFGNRLAERQIAADKLPLTTDLAGTLVTIGGRLAPLLFASEGQINALLPYDIPVNTRHQVIVRRGSSYTVPEAITVAAAQPAIFAKDGTGRGQGVIIQADGKWAEPATPASAGTTIVIFCTGLGEVNPPVEAGRAAPVSPLARVTNEVKLTIGGVDAAVAFAGLVPGFTGFYQVNAVVSEAVQAGDAVPVVLTVAGQPSPPVTMAVR